MVSDDELVEQASALTEVVQGLRSELAKVDTRRKRSALLGWVAIAILVFSLFRIETYTQTINRDAQERAQTNCKNINDTRHIVAQTFSEYTNILIAAGNDTPRTPEEQIERDRTIEKFLEDFNESILADLPQIDCTNLQK